MWGWPQRRPAGPAAEPGSAARAGGHLGLDHLLQVDFIYKVGPFSFIVALLAGAAGMMALNSAKSAALVGVFIGDDGAGRGFRVRRAHRGPVREPGQSALQLVVN